MLISVLLRKKKQKRFQNRQTVFLLAEANSGSHFSCILCAFCSYLENESYHTKTIKDPANFTLMLDKLVLY